MDVAGADPVLPTATDSPGLKTKVPSGLELNRLVRGVTKAFESFARNPKTLGHLLRRPGFPYHGVLGLLQPPTRRSSGGGAGGSGNSSSGTSRHDSSPDPEEETEVSVGFFHIFTSAARTQACTMCGWVPLSPAEEAHKSPAVRDLTLHALGMPCPVEAMASGDTAEPLPPLPSGEALLNIATRDIQRAAALAAWHGDLYSAVELLQQRAEAMVAHGAELSMTVEERREFHEESLLFSMMAMATAGAHETFSKLKVSKAGRGQVAGRGPDLDDSLGDEGLREKRLWRQTCEKLLPRLGRSATHAYGRALICFLLYEQGGGPHAHAGVVGAGLMEVFDDDGLNLTDRVALAVRFLPKHQLQTWLTNAKDTWEADGRIDVSRGSVVVSFSRANTATCVPQHDCTRHW